MVLTGSVKVTLCQAVQNGEEHSAAFFSFHTDSKVTSLRTFPSHGAKTRQCECL